jgi:hypothetical protein
MRTALKLKPGQRGTKKLLAQYGDRLICVRYRYDEEKKKRFKTIELIVEEIDWEPRPRRIRKDTIVGIRVDFKEVELQSKVKSTGGRWNRKRRVWEMRYDRVKELGLEERIVGGSI